MLLSISPLAGPGEHSIPTHSLGRQPWFHALTRMLRFASFLVFLMHTLTYVILLLPFPGLYGARRPQREAADGTPHQ